MIKMVATDIDGTILGESFQFSPRVVECIKNLSKSGVKVVLVTASCSIKISPKVRTRYSDSFLSGRTYKGTRRSNIVSKNS